ncbi:hypothetical protein V6R21_11530 [Limibacter armeniacum]|uniref:hypothetical protein n=1 Tax=Limibacter armeniacum TaxID=466084 RepID=UPI002FE60647
MNVTKNTLTIALFVLFISANKPVNIQGCYSGGYFDTSYLYQFIDGEFKLSVVGHGGPYNVKGFYEVVADTLVLFKVENRRVRGREKMLIDGDSCIIDLRTYRDFCKIELDQDSTFTEHSSRKRKIKK